MNKSDLRPILITSGEPAGIGPELCALLAETDLAARLGRPLVVLGDIPLLTQRAKSAGMLPTWTQIGSLSNIELTPTCHVLHRALNVACVTGKPNPENAGYVLDLLNTACDASLNGLAAAMVTGPIQKSAISPHWPGFIGHTEYLAQRCGQNDVVMMLVGGHMKVALATTHIPLAKVSAAITQDSLTRTLQIMLKDLSTYWGKPKPVVLVAGLNPHAGESGDLGVEEINTISPVIQALQAQGHDVRGPFPADTLFQPKYLEQCDAVLAMYHDQGLPVLKHASFGQGVNISLGLPIVRTSVDHGTALDLAGTRNMDPSSLFEAIECAHHMDLCRRNAQ
ncbi:4-hydroxythreonine-4-phosphate dehydrogenase [Limnobacter thiooxidans]|uniref:4-hydroxythreonine-4-phosphate dehydrogenase PdxA n=1 Tax=Limnobacter thiooxidans TaxID=131080 RepID=A0AA86JDY9_9BURK|nr:4-hydroxythreonine-4-phosphate dehydrogenase [Limnobacter thiooxidans]BET25146.1 4-hydroxythreonine-4-phosphate dehydrogenase PdxA [Limnobacter thiooxidans]